LSDIITRMPRTTIDLDAAVLRELKARSRRDGTSLGALASRLLAEAMHERETSEPTRLEWLSQPMRARVDLDDKEAVRRALEPR
jgi:hypothetical protein